MMYRLQALSPLFSCMVFIARIEPIVDFTISSSKSFTSKLDETPDKNCIFSFSVKLL